MASDQEVEIVTASEVVKMRQALEFYADVSKYPAPLTGGMGELWSDCGQIARAALQAAAAIPPSGEAVPTPAGWALVPARMSITGTAIENAAFMADTEEGATLWVGECGDDEGGKVYGLQISSAEYPEEGCVTLVEFATPPAPVAIDDRKRHAKRLREVAAQLAAERIQGWANPLVANLTDVAVFLDSPEMMPTDPDVVLSGGEIAVDPDMVERACEAHLSWFRESDVTEEQREVWRNIALTMLTAALNPQPNGE